MKKLYRQLADHLRADFDPVVYLATLAMLAVAFVGNYRFDVFRPWVEGRSLVHLPAGALFYAVPWLFVIGLKRARGQLGALDPRLWRMALFAIAVISFALWFPYHRELLPYVPPETRNWTRLVLWNLKSTVLWFTPILGFWLWIDRREPAKLYGLTLEGFDVKPYALLLALLVPVVIWASFEPSFLHAYPTYRPGRAEALVPVWITVPLYELVYGFDFTFVELFFRGFLVIGFARYLGRHAVLPMCAMYVVLHFGKPLPEAVASFFGGYLLGVFALRSRSIAGGVCVHVGIAWSMELAAWMQRLSRG